MTRSKARSLGIKVPDLFPPQNNRSTLNTPASNLPSRPVRTTSQSFSKPSSLTSTENRAKSQTTVSDPLQSAPKFVRPPPNIIDRPLTEPLIVMPEPRLVDKQSVTETTTESPPDLYIPPTPLISEIDNLVTRHIPKQQELDTIMKKIIFDYNLPLDANKLRILQETDPYFKPIYDYLAHDILHSKAKSERSVHLQSEQYILWNGLLFRLCIDENANKFERSTLQLVISETIVDSIILKYHDNLLSNHQGVMRTYLTIRKSFYFRNMFQRI